ncbi:MAG: hypothetical protein ACR2NN_13960 [Bryobacteraceae bacterium]
MGAKPLGVFGMMTTLAASLVAAPAVVTAIGAAKRHAIDLSEVNVVIPNLPKDLDGLRLVQNYRYSLEPISVKRTWPDPSILRTKLAHIALVTGDLISRIGDPLDACPRQLARLRTEAGVLGCLGNHEIYKSTSESLSLMPRSTMRDQLRFAIPTPAAAQTAQTV